MKAVVLNLVRRPERLSRFMAWNGGHDLDFQVAAAVDGAGMDRAALVAEGLLDCDNAMFSDGALGNALSHRAQWQAVVAEGAPRLICEDDACLHGGLAYLLPDLIRVLDRADILFLGYNTNAPLTLTLPEGMVMESYFGWQNEVPDFHAAFAASARRAKPALHSVRAVWGTVAYVVSPVGAQRLLRWCFPLSARRGRIRFAQERRHVRPRALDGMINLALQGNHAQGVACLPPLALSPNDASDVVATFSCP